MRTRLAQSVLLVAVLALGLFATGFIDFSVFLSRAAEFETPGGLLERSDFRKREPDDQYWNGNQHPGPWTCRADIKQRATGTRHRSHGRQGW